jgi:hypothetical protein
MVGAMQRERSFPRRSVIAIAGFVSVLSAMLFLSGRLAFPKVEATLHPTVSVVGRVAHVTGTTDLPDGAVIGYYYWSAADDGRWPDGGQVTANDGQFQFETDFTGWPGGTITLYTEFCVSQCRQPQAVIDRFGPDAERLSGPQANSDSGDPPTLQATASFAVP